MQQYRHLHHACSLCTHTCSLTNSGIAHKLKPAADHLPDSVTCDALHSCSTTVLMPWGMSIDFMLGRRMGWPCSSVSLKHHEQQHPPSTTRSISALARPDTVKDSTVYVDAPSMWPEKQLCSGSSLTQRHIHLLAACAGHCAGKTCCTCHIAPAFHSRVTQDGMETPQVQGVTYSVHSSCVQVAHSCCMDSCVYVATACSSQAPL